MQLTLNPSNYLRSCDGPYRNDIPRKTITCDFGMWNRKHVYTQFFTHLHDPAKLRDQIAHSVNTILQEDDNNGRLTVKYESFTHTPALQFFPSRFATSASTPGIEPSVFHLSSQTYYAAICLQPKEEQIEGEKRSTKVKNPARTETTSKVLTLQPPLTTERSLATSLPPELWMLVPNFVDNRLELRPRTPSPYLAHHLLVLRHPALPQISSNWRLLVLEKLVVRPLVFSTFTTSSRVRPCRTFPLPPPNLNLDPAKPYRKEG
ncbi:hypothetical protein K474DRAFT_1706346 [Panus rudis PR-1116 ss-1]|nr:hypothetical protein K474DRAFT_1706346 [Panus rudis PR-1116 ss-1]